MRNSKTKEKKKHITKDGTNYKKLFFELLAVLVIAFVSMCAVLVPILDEKGAFKTDRYAKWRAIVDEVDEYDYSKGRNLDLEKRLDENYAKKSNEYYERFFYATARITYYCNIGFVNTALDTYKYIEETAYAPSDDDLLDAKVREVLCRRQNANV